MIVINSPLAKNPTEGSSCGHPRRVPLKALNQSSFHLPLFPLSSKSKNKAQSITTQQKENFVSSSMWSNPVEWQCLTLGAKIVEG
jgi:hypothetical protein